MPTRNLRSALDDLASRFASAVLVALQSASLDELAAGDVNRSARTGSRRGKRQASASNQSARPSARSKAAPIGRLERRSPEAIAKAVGRVVSVVKKHKTGLRSEEIRAELGLRANEMPRVLREALAKKALTSKGQRRGTRYLVP